MFLRQWSFIAEFYLVTDYFNFMKGNCRIKLNRTCLKMLELKEKKKNSEKIVNYTIPFAIQWWLHLWRHLYCPEQFPSWNFSCHVTKQFLDPKHKGMLQVLQKIVFYGVSLMLPFFKFSCVHFSWFVSYSLGCLLVVHSLPSLSKLSSDKKAVFSHLLLLGLSNKTNKGMAE